MTPDEFRAMALDFPDTLESSHMGHPDFRVHGKIFATLAPGDERAMVKLTPEQQDWFLRTEPASFEPASGAWGRKGSTMITLAGADESIVHRAVNAAWRNTAPRALSAKHDDGLLT